jgi:hypothetical protein
LVEDSGQAGAYEDLIQRISDMLWEWEGGSELHGEFAVRLIRAVQAASGAIEGDREG